jgi:hypothetical protein
VKAEGRTHLVLWALIAALAAINIATVVALVWQWTENRSLREQLAAANRNVASSSSVPETQMASRLIHEAAQKGQIERLKVLLDEHPGLLNSRPYDSESTPLHAAAFYRRDAVLQELLARKADVNALNKGGLTPLHDCVHRGTVESAAMLLDHKADLSIRNHAGQTPLAYAEARNRPDMVELLRQRGAKE